MGEGREEGCVRGCGHGREKGRVTEGGGGWAWWMGVSKGLIGLAPQSSGSSLHLCC